MTTPKLWTQDFTDHQGNDNILIGGIWFRERQGYKTSRDPKAKGGDRMLEWRTAEGWIPVPMAVGAFMADFFYHNEDFLYPQTLGYQGGERYMSYLREAVDNGWEHAQGKLDTDRARAYNRRNMNPPTQVDPYQ